MKTKKSILLVLSAIMLTVTIGCSTVQQVAIKGGDEQKIYTSNHRGIVPGPDNAVSAATAYSIVEKTNAEVGLIASYSQNGIQSNREGEALGFIINDKHKTWDLTIKTKIGGLTIFQTNVPPEKKLEHRLRWGEYVTVWSDGYQKYTNTLKVAPYADVRTKIKRENKEEEVRGYWMTHLPQ
ncbi:MAG: hypothetical protein WCV70_01325 [Patescibacteria group bacterium]|jgi:hypothetical protein